MPFPAVSIYACKNQKFRFGNYWFWKHQGVRGIFPLQANFFKFLNGRNLREWCLWGNTGSACYLWQISRREFACCTSLGECATTHKDIIVHFGDCLYAVRLCRATGISNKKLLWLIAGKRCPWSSIAVCVSFYEFVILSIKDFSNRK